MHWFKPQILRNIHDSTSLTQRNIYDCLTRTTTSLSGFRNNLIKEASNIDEKIFIYRAFKKLCNDTLPEYEMVNLKTNALGLDNRTNSQILLRITEKSDDKRMSARDANPNNMDVLSGRTYDVEITSNSSGLVPAYMRVYSRAGDTIVPTTAVDKKTTTFSFEATYLYGSLICDILFKEGVNDTVRMNAVDVVENTGVAAKGVTLQLSQKGTSETYRSTSGNTTSLPLVSKINGNYCITEVTNSNNYILSGIYIYNTAGEQIAEYDSFSDIFSVSTIIDYTDVTMKVVYKERTLTIKAQTVTSLIAPNSFMNIYISLSDGIYASETQCGITTLDKAVESHEYRLIVESNNSGLTFRGAYLYDSNMKEIASFNSIDGTIIRVANYIDKYQNTTLTLKIVYN